MKGKTILDDLGASQNEQKKLIEVLKSVTQLDACTKKNCKSETKNIMKLKNKMSRSELKKTEEFRKLAICQYNKCNGDVRKMFEITMELIKDTEKKQYKDGMKLLNSKKATVDDYINFVVKHTP